MRKRVTIPAPASDVELEMFDGKGGSKPFTMEWTVFFRVHILGWTGFDESSDMIKVSESLRSKFVNKKPGDKVEVSENEWEQGCKALKAASIQPELRAALRPLRLAWLQAEDVKDEPASTSDTAVS